MMTAGHLLFAAVTTAYIIVGIRLEERDLVDLFGDDYRRYRDRISMLVPCRNLPDRSFAKMTERSPCASIRAARDRSLLGS